MKYKVKIHNYLRQKNEKSALNDEPKETYFNDSTIEGLSEIDQTDSPKPEIGEVRLAAALDKLEVDSSNLNNSDAKSRKPQCARCRNHNVQSDLKGMLLWTQQICSILMI